VAVGGKVVPRLQEASCHPERTREGSTRLRNKGFTSGFLASTLGMTWLLLGPCLFQRQCDAHPAQIAGALVQVTGDGNVKIRVTFDLLAFVLNDTPQRIGDPPMNALLDGPEADLAKQLAEAKDRFERTFLMWADGNAMKFQSFQFPGLKDVQEWKKSGVQPRLPVMLEARMEGKLLPRTRKIALQFPEVMGQVVVTLESPGIEPRTIALEAGEKSRDLPVQLQSAARPATTAPATSNRSIP